MLTGLLKYVYPARHITVQAALPLMASLALVEARAAKQPAKTARLRPRLTAILPHHQLIYLQGNKSLYFIEIQ